jgi:hypothetical protein
MPLHLQSVSIESLTFDTDLQHELSMKEVSFIVKWTVGGPIRFWKVNWKITGGGWKKAIENMLNSTSGSESFLLGTVPANTEVHISFQIEAFADIPQIVSIVVQTNPGSIVERSPLHDFKAMENGEKWNEVITGTIKS